MSNVVIKTVKRKTTISKAAISKAAKIAYRGAATDNKVDNSRPKAHNKSRKAA
jgi:hypothetical protein